MSSARLQEGAYFAAKQGTFRPFQHCRFPAAPTSGRCAIEDDVQTVQLFRAFASR